jgi:hypothetical protein
MRFSALYSYTFLMILISTSCGVSRPLTAVIRNSRTVVKDANPEGIKITSEYYYLSLRRLVLFGNYTNTKIIVVNNGQLIEQTHTRKISGYTSDKPYFYSTKKIIYDDKGKEQFVNKLKYKKWETINVRNKNIYYENGKKIRVEDCLKN